MPEVEDRINPDDVLEALNRAAYKALDRKRRLGQYAIVEDSKNLGTPRRLEPEEIGEYLEKMDIHETMQREMNGVPEPKPLAKAM